MNKNQHDSIIAEAREGNQVAQELIFVEAMNKKLSNGFDWIDMQLDMEELDEDFRPY